MIHAEAAIEALRALHVESEFREPSGYFRHACSCGQPWPCETGRILDLAANTDRSYVDHLEDALERIAMPRRADGTYNLSREACEQIAKEALESAPPI